MSFPAAEITKLVVARKESPVTVLGSFLRTLPVCAAVLDHEFRILEATEQFEQFYCEPALEPGAALPAAPTPITELFACDSDQYIPIHTQLEALCQALLRGDTASASLEFPYSGDGEPASASSTVLRRWFRLTVQMLPAASDLRRWQPAAQFVAVQEEVSERRKAEFSRLKSEQRFEVICRAIHDLVYDYDIPAATLWWSGNFAEFLGGGQNMVTDITWWTSRIHPSETRTVAGSLEAAIGAGQQYWQCEYRFRRMDETYMHVFDRGHIIYAPSGRPVRMIGSMMDVTARHRANELARYKSRLLARAEQTLAVGSFEWELRTGIMRWSDELYRLLGMEPSTRTHRLREAVACIHPEDRARFDAELRHGLNAHGHATVLHRVLLSDGQQRMIRLEAAYDTEFAGPGRRVFGTALDVTASHARDMALLNSERRFRLTFQQASIGMALLDKNGIFVQVNSALCELLGYRTEELVGRSHSHVTHPEYRQRDAPLVVDLAEGRKANVCVEKRYLCGHGRDVWARVNVTAISDEAGQVTHLIKQVVDITEQRAAEAQLRHMALHDSLTGLPNRAHFLMQLNERLREPAPVDAFPFAIMFLDLDRFKNVNDSMGHQAGDELLVEIARRLRAAVRPQDEVARLGGDEFTVLLRDLSATAEAEAVAMRIQNAIRQPVSVGGQEVFVTVSIGIATSHVSYGAPDELMRDADIAMYSAKAAGKACYRVFDKPMHDRAVERMRLETDLWRALERGELRLHYQPIVCLLTGRILSFEALLRWEHPERGLLMPGSFIEAAEDTGQIVPIGWWTLREACRWLRDLRQQHPAAQELAVDVNLSARQFAMPNLVDGVREILQESGLPAAALRLEITEGTIMAHAERTVETLADLRQLGVDLHMDDFGTGYSSLAYLQRFPINAMKIDRSFVAGMGEASDKPGIVTAIVTLSKSLGMTVIAEGVETQQQLSLLRQAGCNCAQGYLIGKPLPPEQLVERMAPTFLRAL